MEAKGKPAGWEPAGCAFLVDSSMANAEGNRAILLMEIGVDGKEVTDFFEARGLDKFSTGAGLEYG